MGEGREHRVPKQLLVGDPRLLYKSAPSSAARSATTLDERRVRTGWRVRGWDGGSAGAPAIAGSRMSLGLCERGGVTGDGEIDRGFGDVVLEPPGTTTRSSATRLRFAQAAQWRTRFASPWWC